MALTYFLLALVSLQFSWCIDCPPSYREYDGHCYRIVDKRASWTEARHDCQSVGGDLVSINNEQEDYLLRGRVGNIARWYWIGLVYTDGRYKWLDGTDVVYSIWGSGQPKWMDNATANYKAAYYYTSTFHWVELNADRQEFYMCELGSAVTDLQAAIHLECQQHSWYVTVYVDKVSPIPSDISEIYMNEESCVGTLQGNLLVFNKTYQECNTRIQVVNKTVTFNNYILYAIRDSNNVTRELIWKEDLHCSHGDHAITTANIKPDITQHGSSSGQIPGSRVDIKLYSDPAFSHPLQGTVKLGTPVYVQVLSLTHPDVTMVVDSCEADINTNSSQNQKPRPLIQHRCSVEPSTTIIAVRSQATRFRFNLFELPNDQDGIYVRCEVVFCDPMDFSSHCEQTCISSSTLVG